MTLGIWEKHTEWPLTGLSVAFVAIYSWQIPVQPTGVWNGGDEAALNVIWICFASDYVISLWLTSDTWTWFKHHLFELAVVVLPMFRPLRMLRVVTALNSLQHTGGMALRGRIAAYVSSSVTLVVFIGSLAELDAERNAPHAVITSFPKALWWTFVTITTVGYGDYESITATGRTIAFVIMLAGIGLISVVTATMASWIVDEVSAEDKKNTEISHDQVERLGARLAHMEAMLADMQARTGTDLKEERHNLVAKDDPLQ